MVKVRYLGHSAFQLFGSKGIVLIDPYLRGNPKASTNPEEIEADVVLVTHAHGDHLGDAVEIAKKNDAVIVATFELATYCENKGAKVLDGHFGGVITTDVCKVKLFPAVHSSSISNRLVGMPSSFVIEIDSKCIYHAGDTALFSDMSLIGEEFDLDVAMLPIGGHYTMGIDDAVRAQRRLKAKVVVPMHYNTHDRILADPKEFKDKLERSGPGKCVILIPGQDFEVA
jgi:L-ascorbate metabolism protein UlaG (beta-lactamase superfamily)